MAILLPIIIIISGILFVALLVGILFLITMHKRNLAESVIEIHHRG